MNTSDKTCFKTMWTTPVKWPKLLNYRGYQVFYYFKLKKTNVRFMYAHFFLQIGHITTCLFIWWHSFFHPRCSEFGLSVWNSQASDELRIIKIELIVHSLILPLWCNCSLTVIQSCFISMQSNKWLMQSP